jgi:hypothetical protein
MILTYYQLANVKYNPPIAAGQRAARQRSESYSVGGPPLVKSSATLTKKVMLAAWDLFSWIVFN